MMKKLFTTICICAFLVACSSENDASNGGNTGGDGTNGGTSQLNQQGTGTSAHDLLSDDTYTKMVVELAFVEGFSPTEKTKNDFKSFLESRINKPQGIEFITKQIPNTGKTTYSINDVRNIENEQRTQFTSGNTIAVWALFVNGESDRNTSSGSILGTAYLNTSFVIYEETIHEFSDSTFEPNRSVLETTVINHEFGHILGLTNLGTDLQSDHEDAEHEKHCNVKNCLMYWSAETNQGIENLVSSGEAAALDAQCIADLQANGGK